MRRAVFFREWARVCYGAERLRAAWDRLLDDSYSGTGSCASYLPLFVCVYNVEIVIGTNQVNAGSFFFML